MRNGLRPRVGSATRGRQTAVRPLVCAAIASRKSHLIQHRRPLRRRFGQVNCIHLIGLSVVPHAMDLVGVGENTIGLVAPHGAVFPGTGAVIGASAGKGHGAGIGGAVGTDYLALPRNTLGCAVLGDYSASGCFKTRSWSGISR